LALATMLQDDFSFPAHGTSPLQIVVMLYDNALKSMKDGKAAIKAGDFGRKDVFIDRTEQIVTALMNCHDTKGEMALDLRTLYCYVLNELAEAREESSTHRLERCELVMKDLRKAWLELEACMLPDSGFGSAMAA
jgi:flagellar protein FliS